MYMLTEDYEYHDRLFNSLDESKAHDFMELLLTECSRKTGNDEWIITVRSAGEIAALEVPQDHIITREMVDDAYRTVTTVGYEGDEDE